jgi:hypothetical protein
MGLLAEGAHHFDGYGICEYDEPEKLLRTTLAAIQIENTTIAAVHFLTIRTFLDNILPFDLGRELFVLPERGKGRGLGYKKLEFDDAMNRDSR